MFNYNKVAIDSKGYDNPVTYLIQNRYLANPRFVPIGFESNTVIDEPQAGMDYSAHDLESLGRDDRRTRRIIELAEDAAARHPRTITFCPSVESALDCNKRLKAKGIATGVVTASTSREARQFVLNKFKNDCREHMVLFNYGVLTTGFDAPRTRCVIIARPTTSLVLYSQMVGRALRGPRVGGNSKAEILTVADTNLPGFGSVTEAFTNWEDLWSTNSAN